MNERETARRASGVTEHLPTREGYDRWSEVYDVEENPLVALEEPRARELLGDVRGRDVLDVGCGTGRHAVRMADEGARVTALDFSDGMLAKAQAKGAAGGRLAFRRHDLGHPLPFEGRSFDRVLCALVLDHIRDLAGLFGELARVCRQDGIVVVTVMHPAMMLRGVQARFVDPASKSEVRPRSVPNQVSDYLLAALAAGLSVAHASEHAVDAELAARVPRGEKYVGWPMLLLLVLRPGADSDLDAER